MIKSHHLQGAFYRHTFQRYEILAPNVYFGWEGNEMDLVGVRKSGFIDEIEIKLTRSDYLADFKKTYRANRFESKHDAIEKGLLPCNYFSFLMPEELAEKCDIPHYAGLYTFRINKAGIGRVSEIKRAKLLHRNKVSDARKYELGKKMAYRYWNQNNYAAPIEQVRAMI